MWLSDSCVKCKLMINIEYVRPSTLIPSFPHCVLEVGTPVLHTLVIRLCHHPLTFFLCVWLFLSHFFVYYCTLLHTITVSTSLSFHIVLLFCLKKDSRAPGNEWEKAWGMGNNQKTTNPGSLFFWMDHWSVKNIEKDYFISRSAVWTAKLTVRHFHIATVPPTPLYS